MQLQNIDIFSTGGFIFFLLIILVGYLWVEIIFGKDYIFRNIFEKYNNSLFDRMIHYIIWGFLINLTIFIFFYYNSGMEYIKLIDDAGKVAIALQPIIGEENTLSAQFLFISIFQFLLIFSIGGILWIIREILALFFRMGNFFIEKKKKIKKKRFFQKFKSKLLKRVKKKSIRKKG